MTTQPSKAATRAAKEIAEGYYDSKQVAYIIDRETGLPELLEALELAQATIERVNPKVHNSCCGTLDVIRRAIAKAEGKQA